jgi:hypothetical protein
VSMNTQGITVQAAAGRPIMSGLMGRGAWARSPAPPLGRLGWRSASR